MARMSRIFCVAALGLALGGCVSQEKYNALRLDRDGLAEQLSRAQTDLSAAQREAQAYKDQLAQIVGSGNNLQGLVTNLQQQNANLQAQLDQLNSKYAEAMNRVGTGPALPRISISGLRGTNR